MKKDMINIIEDAVKEYELCMLRNDSEVEIDIDESEVWLCDYSESRGGAEFIKKLCEKEDIDHKELIALCEKYNWCYCF